MNTLFTQALAGLIPLILSLTIHEWAHARAAFALGDRTAHEQGRLTLNPVSHIDPFGTVLLPLLMMLTQSSFMFGWAKPVPFSPTRFSKGTDMRTGTLLVALAGPVSNLLTALLVTGAMAVAWRTGYWPATRENAAFVQLGSMMIATNVALALFNFLPVPPLDGSKVLWGVLPRKWADQYEQLMQSGGMFFFMALVVFGGRLISPLVERALFVLHNVIQS